MKTIPAPLEAGRMDPLQSLQSPCHCRCLRLTAACASIILLTTTTSPGAADYGDAPDGTDSYYPVLAGQPHIVGRFPTLYNTGNSRVGAPGVHHAIVGEEWFGPPATPPSAEADAVDPGDPDGRDNLVNNDAFDDGLPPIPFFLVLTSLPPGAAITFRVTVAAGAPDVYRYVNMLIDWDRSGDWKNLSTPGAAPEWVIMNRVVDQKPGTSQWITVPISWGLGAQLAPQIFWLRMSLSRTMLDPAAYGPDGWDGSGAFSHGETEDYLFHPSRKHDDPSPFPPPPLPLPPSGGYFSSLPGIQLVPTHQDVAHGTPAVVTVQMIDYSTRLPITTPPPAFLGWAVDASFNGPPSIPPTGFAVGGVINWPAPGGSGSSATWTNGTPPNVATITVNSTLHNFWSPEEWAFRVRAKWPGIHCHTRKAIVHIWHSWPFGCFSLWSQYNFLNSGITSLPLSPAELSILTGHAEDARTAWQQNDLPAMTGALNLLAGKLDLLLAEGKITEVQRNNLVATSQQIENAALLLGAVPVPVWATPVDGDTVRLAVPVTVTTLSPDVTKVVFAFSGTDGIRHPIGEDSDGADGWTIPWNTLPLTDGVYQLYAAMENAGGLVGENQVSVWVDNTVPAPIPMAAPPVVAGLTELSVMAADPQRDVASCAFAISRDGLHWFGLPTDYGGEDDELWKTQLDTGQLEQGTYQVRATVSDEAGNEEVAVWLMDVQPSYAAWKQQYAITDDNEDSDCDSLGAVMEYYFGTDPTIADPPGSAFGLHQTPGATWELWWKRRPWLDGMVAIAEESQDLLNWTELKRDPPDGSGVEMRTEISSGLPANFTRFHFIETR